MQSVISPEEFQRFQTQLLDLREAQILATEAKLNAEKRVNLLESEIAGLRTALTEAQSLGNNATLRDLHKENQLLREKLLSTESAFQLQSSTLHAECHRLTAELGQLREAQMSPPKLDADCQTDDEYCHDSIQPTTGDSVTLASQYSIEELNSLKSSLNEADLIYDRIKTAVEILESKVVSMESIISSKILMQQETLLQLSSQKEKLEAEVEQSNKAINRASETEKDLRNQLEVVKRRSEKLNRELRRQLNRFLRAKATDNEPGVLHRNSLHSSSSSLSVNLNGTGATCNGFPTDVDPLSNPTECAKPEDIASCKSKTSFDDLPPGFFSMTDFKSLIDRMSEVQEENCTLRRHNQILQAEVLAKSQAIQHELNKQLLKTPTPNQSTSSLLDFSLSNLSWFTSSKQNPNLKSTSLSSANLETVNRLKLMCEQLITQNIQLTEKLQAYESLKTSS